MHDPADELWPEIVRLVRQYAVRKYRSDPFGITVHVEGRQVHFEPFPARRPEDFIDLPPAERPSRGPRFDWVRWPGAGRAFFPTPLQQGIVARLWAAWENGEHDVPEVELLDAGNSRSERLQDVFKRNPAFGSIIVRGSRPGTFRLAPLPGEEVGPPGA